MEDLVKAEVNVKEIEYLDPDNTFISKKIKPNFVALGKKLGPKMKTVAALLTRLNQEQIRQLKTAVFADLLDPVYKFTGIAFVFQMFTNSYI